MDAPLPSPAPAPQHAHGLARGWVAALLLLMLLLAIAAAAASLAWWAVRSEPGSAWLVSRLPGVQVSGPKGHLLGDFGAQHIEIQWPGEGGKLVLDGMGWRGLRIDRAAPGLRLRIAIDELQATRVELQRAATPSRQPLQAPASLRAPIELEVRTLRVGELHDPALGDKPLRDVQAGVHLGADAGAAHRIDALSFAWDRLRATGAARIAADLPMALDARLNLTQQAEGATTAWSANATLIGPLASPLLQGAVRAQPLAPGSAQAAQPAPAPAPRPAQSLDARATLRPFAAWPLGDLKASTAALDLSAFHSSAPVTALSGEAIALTAGVDQPVTVSLNLTNSQAGRWNEGRLPVRSLKAELRGRVDDTSTLDLNGISADLGTLAQSAGHVQGQGRWMRERWTLDATLSALQPSLLDARAAAMQLSGPLKLVGTGFDTAAADGASLEVKTDLTGQLADRGPARAAQLKFDARVNAQRIEVRDAQLQAGGARASLSGLMSRAVPGVAWHAKGQAALVDFDPSPWWPGREDSPWRKGPHRLNAKGEFDIDLPPMIGARPWAEQLAALRGKAGLSIGNSLLAGVPMSGEATLRSAEGGQAVSVVALQADGNSVRAEGRLSTRANGIDGTSDTWDVTLAAPALSRLAPVWRLLQNPGADGTLAGTLNATARVNGRWPDITTQGQLDGSAVRIGALSAQTVAARWQMGTSADAPIEAQATLAQATLAGAGGPSVEAVQLQLKGTARAHSIELRAEAKALPPAWTEALQAAPTAASGVATARAPATAPATASGLTNASAPSRTLALMQAQGAVVAVGASGFAGWRGAVQQLELRGNVAGAVPWVRARDISLDLQWAGGPPRVTVQPGRAEVLGGALRWSRMAWQGANGAGATSQLEVEAELEPLQLAPLLARVQPDFGWGGDLAITGRLDIRSAPAFSADIVIERSRGDLTVTDETGTQSLGLTDLRLGLIANDGVWSFTQGLAGKTLGVAAGAVVARTSPQATWPSADTPIQGVLELQVANLGTWGTWVPAGWRLGGELRTSATIAGRFGAPEYTGEVRGKELSVRNFLQGVNVADGDVVIALQGTTARIERFSARAGAGTVQLEGSASLGEAPQAQLKVTASKFQLLGRVDRRIVTSGQAQLKLDREALALDGRFGIDEGLIDFTRSDAPSLSDDVEVRRAKPADAPPPPAAKGIEAGGATTPAPAAYRKVALDLRVALGEQLRLRGRGLDTGLRGELRITSPGGKLAINGSVSTADGTYAAYGQKLTIDRGTLSFNGPAENPRLDIEATRPNIDVRVGVAVTGTAVSPRVRLFSEPELSDIDKLSWLVLGRASDGLGRTDTALLQRAALALLAGEGEGITGQFTKAIGLDEVSLRQSDGEVRETVISLGKQLSRRWYVGYERGLNATTGTWQLIYRVAQRFTLRAQSGLDNSLDVIWTWRWQ